MASIPSMRTRQATLQQIDGAMPRLHAIPTGCAFNPRCARASAQCRAEKPVLETQSHAIACWHPFEGEAHG
jgi:peptide/nickel transport system ATP-binding protein